MKSTTSVSPRFLSADRHSFNRMGWTLTIAMLSLGSALTVRAAQETFWPFNSFPPPGWRFSSTSEPATVFADQGQVVLVRNFVISDLKNPIILPALGNSITNNANVRVDCQLSYDSAMNWLQFSGNGDMTLVLSHTNEAPGVRMFGTEIMGLDMVLTAPNSGGPPFLFFIRESHNLTSSGQLVVTATNGGFLLSSFVDLSLERGENFGAFWFPAASPAHVELSGPAGVPSVLSVSLLSATNAMICWNTQTNGQYQLQRQNSVADTNWTSVGAALPGNGSNVCVLEAIDPGTNQFYRVQLSP